MCINSRTPVLLQMAKTLVYNPQEPHNLMEVRLILDNGSQRSYVSNKVRGGLGLQSVSVETLSIKTFGATEEERQTYDVVNLGVATKCGPGLEIPILVLPLICGPLFNQPTACLRERYEHLSGLELADSSCDSDNFDVDIFIGSDLYWRFVKGRTLRGRSGPTAIQSKFGWVLSGPAEQLAQEDTIVNLVSTHILRVDSQTMPIENQDLDTRLKTFWDLESLGLCNSDSSVYSEFTNSISFNDNRYEVCLPSKE